MGKFVQKLAEVVFDQSVTCIERIIHPVTKEYGFIIHDLHEFEKYIQKTKFALGKLKNVMRQLNNYDFVFLRFQPDPKLPFINKNTRVYIHRPSCGGKSQIGPLQKSWADVHRRDCCTHEEGEEEEKAEEEMKKEQVHGSGDADHLRRTKADKDLKIGSLILDAGLYKDVIPQEEIEEEVLAEGEGASPMALDRENDKKNKKQQKKTKKTKKTKAKATASGPRQRRGRPPAAKHNQKSQKGKETDGAAPMACGMKLRVRSRSRTGRVGATAQDAEETDDEADLPSSSSTSGMDMDMDIGMDMATAAGGAGSKAGGLRRSGSGRAGSVCGACSASDAASSTASETELMEDPAEAEDNASDADAGANGNVGLDGDEEEGHGCPSFVNFALDKTGMLSTLSSHDENSEASLDMHMHMQSGGAAEHAHDRHPPSDDEVSSIAGSLCSSLSSSGGGNEGSEAPQHPQHPQHGTLDMVHQEVHKDFVAAMSPAELATFEAFPEEKRLRVLLHYAWTVATSARREMEAQQAELASLRPIPAADDAGAEESAPLAPAATKRQRCGIFFSKAGGLSHFSVVPLRRHTVDSEEPPPAKQRRGSHSSLHSIASISSSCIDTTKPSTSSSDDTTGFYNPDASIV